jgi:polar amino acid transport system ATP-binding protein
MKHLAVFRNVTKRFGHHTVLNGFDFDVMPGERVTLVGSSGSGKSTVLRILMTLEPFQSGTVEVDGLAYHLPGQKPPFHAPERHLSDIRSRVGMVFQQFNLFPHMTVRRNLVHAPMSVLGLSRKEAERRAMELLAMVGLTDKADAFPDQLSGGQQQRIAIARALAMRPRLLLFDEPTSALDPETVVDVLSVIRKLADEHDLTMILVTHEMGFAREISDRICFLDRGRIIEQGRPDRLLQDPQHPRTREFLASIPASGTTDEGGLRPRVDAPAAPAIALGK